MSLEIRSGAEGGVILLASPRDWLASSLRAVLEPQGWGFSHVPSATALRTAVEETPPDVVILDEGLPDGSVRELCAELGRAAQNGIPVLVYSSGDWESSDREGALGAGAWDFIVEPVRSQELLDKLSRLGQLKSMMDASSVATGSRGPGAPYHLGGLLRTLPLLRSIAERSGADVGCAVVGPTRPEADEPSLEAQRADTLSLVTRQIRESDLCAWVGPADLAVLLYGAGIDGLGAFVGRIARSGMSRGGGSRSLSAGIVALPRESRTGGRDADSPDRSTVGVLGQVDAARAALRRAREAGGGVRVATEP